MTELNIEAEGLDTLVLAMQRAPGETTAIINDSMRSIGQLFVPAKGTGPLAIETPKDKGNLAKSTFFEIQGSGASQTLLISQPARTPAKYGSKFYGPFVRGGTKAHKIKPRFASALRWETTSGVVFAKEVNHPGTQANPYHIRVLRRLMPGVNNIMFRMGERLGEILGRA